MKHYKKIIFIAVVLHVVNCATVQENHFRVPKEKVFSEIKIIALSPIVLPLNIPAQNDKKQIFEVEIQKQLESFGYTVIPSDTFFKIFTQNIRFFGGTYDAKNGNINMTNQQYKNFQKYCRERMKTIHKADAILYTSISVYTIDYKRSMVTWHGTSANVESGGSNALRFLGGIFGVDRSYEGSCPVLSLDATLSDTSGAVLYSNQGGIELLMKVNASGKMEKVEIDKLLVDNKKNLKSVKIALGQLNKKV